MKNMYLTTVIIITFATIHFCSGMETNNDDTQQNKKTLSTLFKLMYKDEPTQAKTNENFYTKNLITFNNKSNQLRKLMYQAQINTDSVEPIKKLNAKIITDDLIPLRHKIINILACIQSHNLYRINYSEQSFKKDKNQISPRIQIIDFIIKSLQTTNLLFDDKKIQNYQLIINHIAYFEVKKGHDEMVEYTKSWIHTTNKKIVDILEVVFSNNPQKARELAISLNDETINKEELKMWKKNTSTHSIIKKEL